jgi:multidrug transporter EmrE-like cation transporter
MTVMLIAVIGKVFFREEFGKLGMIGIVLTMVSIVLVNI